jgi:hypothetical protein
MGNKYEREISPTFLRTPAAPERSGVIMGSCRAVSIMVSNWSLFICDFRFRCEGHETDVATQEITFGRSSQVSTDGDDEGNRMGTSTPYPRYPVLTSANPFFVFINMSFKTPTTDAVPRGMGNSHSRICQML